MTGFSQLRFSTYAKDLSQAVYDLSKQKMSDYGKSSSIPHVRQPKQVSDLPISYTPIAGQSFMSETPETGTELPKVDVVPPPAPKPAEPIKKSVTGAGSLANLLRTQQAALKAQFAKHGEEFTALMADLQDTANEASNQLKAGKAEAADLKAALGLNSNGDPD